MLVFSLVLTVILLATAIGVAHKGATLDGWIAFLGTGLGVTFFPTCLFFFPPVILTFAFLVIALGIWTVWRSRIKWFWPMGVAAVGLAYLVVGVVTLSGNAPYGKYRQQYPLESMAERVPEPAANAAPSPALDETGLTTLELAIENDMNYRVGLTRRHQLQELHENRVREFVASPGFGIGRLPSPTPWLEVEPRDRAPEQSVDWLSTDHVVVPAKSPEPNRTVALGDLHQTALIDFLNPGGFGYVKDRMRVAGFQPHGFSRKPRADKTWTIERIELVSLLIHPKPAVYLTDTLPTMEGVRDFPTRPLDEFETPSLKLLRAGEDLTSASGGEVTRAFGSIRSAKQCVTCHGGERGDLLGAFSYTLREDKAKKP